MSFEIASQTPIATILTANCMYCSTEKQLVVETPSFYKWVNKEQFIQNAFPNMSVDDRELLISNTCQLCWDSIFGNDEEDYL